MVLRNGKKDNSGAGALVGLRMLSGSEYCAFATDMIAEEWTRGVTYNCQEPGDKRRLHLQPESRMLGLRVVVVMVEVVW